MQSLPNRREPFSYDGTYSRSVYPPRVADSATQSSTQIGTSHYNAQPSTGPTPVPSGSGIGRRSDMYGGDPIPGYEFNYSMAGSWDAPAPQPQSHSGYMRPVQYNNVEQGGINYAGYASPFPAPTMSLSPLLYGAYTAPNYQGAFPIWHFFSGWVSYAAQDELHVTVILRRFPSA